MTHDIPDDANFLSALQRGEFAIILLMAIRGFDMFDRDVSSGDQSAIACCRMMHANGWNPEALTAKCQQMVAMLNALERKERGEVMQ